MPVNRRLHKDRIQLIALLAYFTVAMTIRRYVYPTMEVKRRNMAKML